MTDELRAGTYVYRDGRLVPKETLYVGVSGGPYVISDEMSATEQVDGKFYTSKARFRAVGRALGLTEVGNEKHKPHVRSTDRREVREARTRAVREAFERYRAGHRPGQ